MRWKADHGILDSIESRPCLKGALGQLDGGGGAGLVLSEVLAMADQADSPPSAARLQHAGFGDQNKSWIGNGQ